MRNLYYLPWQCIWSQPIFRGKMLVSGGVCVDLFIGMVPPQKRQDVDTSQLFVEHHVTCPFRQSGFTRVGTGTNAGGALTHGEFGSATGGRSRAAMHLKTWVCKGVCQDIYFWSLQTMEGFSCFTRKVLWHIVDAHVLSFLCPTIAAYMFEEKYADMADIQWFIRITRVKNVLYIFAIPVPNGVGSDLLPAMYRHKGMILRLFLPGIRLSSWNSGCHLWDTLCGAAAGAFCKAIAFFPKINHSICFGMVHIFIFCHDSLFPWNSAHSAALNVQHHCPDWEFYTPVAGCGTLGLIVGSKKVDRWIWILWMM